MTRAERAAARQAWDAAGPLYDEFAASLRPAAEHLLDALHLQPGLRLLDLACGTGLLALAAATRGLHVTGIDFAPCLVAAAQQQAALTGTDVDYLVGDIENLPFAARVFDAVLSNIGSIFASSPRQLVDEVARVLRPPGRFAFTAWISSAMHVRLMTLTCVAQTTPAPAGPGMFDWGCLDYCAAELGHQFEIEFIDEGNAPLVCPSPSAAVELLLYRALGPLVHAFAQLPPAGQLAVHSACVRLLTDCLLPDGSIHIDRPYLVIVARLRG
jgi:SAM-dependent methyltransferase